MSEMIEIHYVGSLYPAAKGASEPTADAIRAQIDPFRKHPELISHISSGERGDSRGYVQRTINHLAKELAPKAAVDILHNASDEDSLWRTMDQRTRMRFRPGRHLEPGNLDYAAAAITDWNTYCKVRAEYRAATVPAPLADSGYDQGLWRNDWRFQYSVPTPLSTAIVALGPEDLQFTGSIWQRATQVFRAAKAIAHTFRHHDYFREATVYEVEKINHAIPAGESVAQIEATAEMLITVKAYEKSPKTLGPLVARAMGRRIATMVNLLPPSVDIDLHYCLGSLNNKAEVEMRDLRPFVAISNVVTKELNRTPLHVHCPIAPSDTAARQDSKYYAPLAELALPDDTEFYPGFVNNHQSVQKQLAIWQMIKQLVKASHVGIATSCGMGRYEREPGLKLHNTLAEIAASA